jgi:hypothetical protein
MSKKKVSSKGSASYKHSKLHHEARQTVLVSSLVIVFVLVIGFVLFFPKGEIVGQALEQCVAVYPTQWIKMDGPQGRYLGQTVEYVPGIVSNSASFTDDNYMRDTVIFDKQQFVVEFWMRTPSITGVRSTPIGVPDSWLVVIEESALKFMLATKNEVIDRNGNWERETTWNDFSVPVSLANGAWHHIVVGFTPAKIDFWVDGFQLPSPQNVPPIVYGRFKLLVLGGYLGSPMSSGNQDGELILDNNYYFHGQMDEVRVYNTMPTDIPALFQVGKNRILCGDDEARYNFDSEQLCTENWISSKRLLPQDPVGTNTLQPDSYPQEACCAEANSCANGGRCQAEGESPNWGNYDSRYLICSGTTWRECNKNVKGQSPAELNTWYCDGTNWFECKDPITESKRLLPGEDGETLQPESYPQLACCGQNSCADGGRCYDEGESPRWTAGFDTSYLICDGSTTWRQCDADGKDARVADSYCDGSNWISCDANSDILCTTSNIVKCDANNINDVEDHTGGDKGLCRTDGTNYQWKLCNEDTAGEGVDNAPNAAWYDNKYVCGKQDDTYTWIEIVNQCNTCAGDKPGKCVGSDIKRVTGEVIEGLEYFDQGLLLDPGRKNFQQNLRLGCVLEDECVQYLPLDSTFTKATSSYDALDRDHGIFSTFSCGLDHSWTTCLAGDVYSASDGGKWLCDGAAGRDGNLVPTQKDSATYGTWKQCNPSTLNDRVGEWTCTTEVSGRYTWFSQFSCTASQKYSLLNEETYICDLGVKKNCANITATPIADPTVEVSCDINRGQISIREIQCTDDIDNDNDGKLDCADPDCVSNNLDRSLDIKAIYEVTVEKGNCFEPNIKKVSPEIKEMNLCDLGTEVFNNRATVCYKRDGMDQTQAVESNKLLANAFHQPVKYDDNSIFIFEEGEPKQVSLVLAVDIGTNPARLPLGNFSANLPAGKRIAFILDDEYYLMSYPEITQTGFDESRLKLKHLATGRILGAEPYQGTNMYLFRVQGGQQRLITFTVDVANGDFVVTARRLDETVQAAPIISNLAEMFEISFSKAAPVRLFGADDLGVLSVCRDDNDADPFLVSVCRNNEEVFTLEADKLLKKTIEGNNYALLFEVIDNEKKVSIFLLNELFNTPTDLSYSNFLNSMVAGRRAAFEFRDTLYLLEHPAQQFISLPDMTLRAYTEEGVGSIEASGSRDEANFLLFDGKITFNKFYGQPQPPFTATALTIQEIDPVVLSRDLSTAMSSRIPVKVNGGLLYSNDNTYAYDENVFDVLTELNPTKQIRLFLGEPQEFSVGTVNMLLLYDTVSTFTTKLVKHVSVYHLEDISGPLGGDFRMSYTPKFIETLADGKEFAISFNGAYYLVYYENNNEEVLSFNINRLRMSNLAKSQFYNPRLVERTLQFALPGGALSVEQDYDTNNFVFSSRIGGDVTIIEFPEEEYSFELSPTRRVQLEDGTLLELCNLNDYASTTAVEVCIDVGQRVFLIDINTPQLLDFTRGYLFEVNGLTGDNKKVIIRKEIPLDYGDSFTDSWTAFTDRLLIGDLPLLNLGSKWFLPKVTNNLLSTFYLETYPSGTTYPMQNLKQKTQITWNGTVVINDKELFIDQERKKIDSDVRLQQTEATFTLENNFFLPRDNSPIVINSSQLETIKFRTNLDGDTYEFKVTLEPRSPLVKLSLQDSSQKKILSRYFQEGDLRYLYLDGVRIELKVDVVHSNSVPPGAIISIKRT